MLIDEVYNQDDQAPASGSLPSEGRRSVKVKALDQKHPEYKLLRATWEKLSLLYAGGWALKQQAELFLTRRPKELGDVYQARLANFTYHNHLGTALDWYASELFEEDPYIDAVEVDPLTGERSTKQLSAAQKIFYDKFLLDCDRGGTSFTDTFRQVFQNVLLYQKSYVVMDLPPAPQFPNRAEQVKSGALDPYLCVYNPMQAINWELDSYGNLNWIFFSVSFRSSKAAEEPTTTDRWYYYDRQRYEVWEYKHPEDQKSVPDQAMATLIDTGNHLLAASNTVPVSLFSVPDGLWLANRAMLAAQSHLNTDNVLDWALFMAALAMPVIMSDANITPTLSEAGFILLPKDSKYEWTEPVGTSFKHLADRLGELTENIFRSFYLIHQGRSGRSTPVAQSGVSKQMDMMPSKDILKMFGDLLRAFMQRVLNRVSEARKSLSLGDDNLQWDVRGFEFKDDISDAEVQTVADAMALDVPSVTFEKEAYKRLAKSLTPDANPSVHRKMFQEIDGAPDRNARLLAKQQASLEMQVDAMPAPGEAKRPKVAPSTSTDVGQDAGADDE